jgi:tetratricopeptide (TPR) repeat protein
LAVGRIYERAGLFDRAEACYRRAASTWSRAPATANLEVRSESLYRLGLRCRRERRFTEAVAIWQELVALTEPRSARRQPTVAALRQYAAEALAIHHEHRERDLETARDLALFALKERTEDGRDDRRAVGFRHRLARLERKLEKEERKLEREAERQLGRAERRVEKENAQLLWS